MAKFYMEDGSIKSFDQLVNEYNEMSFESISKSNRHRLISSDTCDLIRKICDNIQKGNDINKECILDIITGKHHDCDNKECRECLEKWFNDNQL